jgi:hypothetical protein
MGTRARPQSAHACCANPLGHNAPVQSPADPGNCPLCQNSNLINKTVTKASPNLDPHAFCMAFAPVDTTLIALNGYAVALDRDLVPFAIQPPPTLLSLHCALIS